MLVKKEGVESGESERKRHTRVGSDENVEVLRVAGRQVLNGGMDTAVVDGGSHGLGGHGEGGDDGKVSGLEEHVGGWCGGKGIKCFWKG